MASEEQIGSTEHFWYRLQPVGPYIDSQRDSKAFGHADGKIYLSEDNGRTWPHSAAFPNAHNITPVFGLGRLNQGTSERPEALPRCLAYTSVVIGLIP